MKTRSQIKHHEWRIKQKVRRWLKWSWYGRVDGRLVGKAFKDGNVKFYNEDWWDAKSKTRRLRSDDEMFKLETRNNEKE